jgi:hypothetical protein
LTNTIRQVVVWSAVVTLPALAFALFLDATRPSEASLGQAYMAVAHDDGAGTAAWFQPRRNVRHISGVSAEVGIPDTRKERTRLVDLRSTVSPSEFSLAPGAAFQYVSQDGHRLVLHIVSRDALTDGVVPANQQLMNIAPASTQKLISFVWGQWVYRAEIEDLGLEENVAVQKSL